MPRVSKLGFGTLAVGWLGLAVAFRGIAETPTRWCSLITPEPSGQHWLHAGTAVAVSAVVLSCVPALVIPAFRSERARDWPTPLLTAAWIATAVALVSALVLARELAGGEWYCP
jgi:hypothetical protein